MFGGTLPTWLVILFVGVVVNLLLGSINPFVAKEYKDSAEAYRQNGFEGEAPKVVVKYRLSGSGVPLFLDVCFFTVVPSVFFFIETFLTLSNAFGGGFIGIVGAILVYLLGLFCWTVLMMCSLFIGETLEFEQIYKYYHRRFGIRVIDQCDLYEPNDN